MNKELTTNIILAVLGVAIILVGVAVYLQGHDISNLSQQITGVSQSIDALSQKAEATPAKTDSGSQAPEKSAVKTPESVKLSGLTFDLPTDWSVSSLSSEVVNNLTIATAKLSVPDPKYDVVIPLRVWKLTGEPDVAPFTAEFRSGETKSGEPIYICTEAPSLLCRNVEHAGEMYEVVFDPPESNEQAPSNLDGVWFPSTTVTEAMMQSVVETVH